MVHFSNSKEGIHEGQQVRDEAGNVQAFPAWMHSFPPASTFMEISLESFLWSLLNTHFPRAHLQTLILEGAGSFRNCQTRTTGSGFCAGEYLILVQITQPLTPFQESLFFVCHSKLFCHICSVYIQILAFDLQCLSGGWFVVTDLTLCVSSLYLAKRLTRFRL